ncbi:hypothetical protein BB561_003798 [Smittium simulii]|uniref:DNA-directed RNA polymerase III subunit RPC9 n=1 Tax=Smittium simulii TaxID=133385 RepID=A0A2T9YJI3_9FUNG|nr:hypothetical protein BB561_003798 [Smittium simulii]
MKVLEAQSALLSNYEVLELILSEKKKVLDSIDNQSTTQVQPNGNSLSVQDSKNKHSDSHAKLQQPANLLTIEHELLQYLQDENLKINTQSAVKVGTFLTNIQKFKLTKAEKLQLLNLAPEKQVDLYLVIEEPEERFTSEEISELINIVADSLN